MLDLRNFGGVVADNEVSINGVVIGRLSDDDATKLIAIIKGMSGVADQASTPAPKQTRPIRTLHLPEERKSYQGVPSTAKKLWQDDVVTVGDDDGKIRVWITTFSKAARYQAKMEAKKYGATWTGNVDKGIIHWTFPTKKAATEFIKARKDWAAKNPKEKA